MKVKAIHCLTCGHIIDIEEGKQKQTCNACSNSFILDQEQVQPIYNQKVIINKFGLDSADGNFQQGIYHPNELYEISQKINMI
jgi:DNA-directed RNA polymerase subunit RPC12/RpoP